VKPLRTTASVADHWQTPLTCLIWGATGGCQWATLGDASNTHQSWPGWISIVTSEPAVQALQVPGLSHLTLL